MKKNLLSLTLLAVVSALSAKAAPAPFWYDVATNYPIGGLTTNTAVWYPHLPGSTTAHDTLVVTNITYTSGAAVNGRRLRINGLNSEYIMRLFDPINTNAFGTGSGTILYASFVATANFVPGAGAGTYFATFNDLGTPPSATNGFEFRGRVFEIGNTNVYPFTTTTAGTFRYGVANGAGDPAQGGGPSIIYVPIDLIKNIDYQVVLKYDIDNAVASLWVNPASEADTANMIGPTADPGAVATGLAGLLFRQRTGGGTVDIRDIAVGTNFTDVMTNLPGPVLVATNVFNITNYSGNPAIMEVFASSIGGGVLSYQWYQVVAGVTNAVGGANSQTYVISSLASGDQGSYFCAVTNSGSIGALSRTNFVMVKTNLTAPAFTTQPVTKGVSVGGNLTETCLASGTGPLTFQWYLGGNALVNGQPGTMNPGDVSVVSGSQSPTLTITGVSTNESGIYTVTVTGGVAPPATSTNAVVTVNPPQAKTIAFLKTLLNTSTWQPTDTSSTFSINGVVTTVTNLTSGNTSSYYIQDSTGGIDLFVTGDSSFRPNRGDVVKASGTLSSFNNTLELACNAANPYQSYGVVAPSNYSTLPAWAITNLPAPAVFNPLSTNIAGLMETNYEGLFVMMTNVLFTAPGGTFPAGANVLVTNQNGVVFNLFISGQIGDVPGQTIPGFAWSVLGAINQFKSGAYSSAGYELNLTSMADLITNPPPAVTATVGANGVLTWTAVPYSYSYSVLVATDVKGPYAPLATGLTFNTANGTYTDTALSTYQANLLGTNEVVANLSTASGAGAVVLSPDQSTIFVNLNFTGLSTNATAAHIHGPAGAGTNASVLFPFTGVPGATSGAIPQQSFAITSTQVGYLQNGLLYMNVHDATYPNGEIRAQLVPATAKFYKVVTP
jgi:hypothetical protein